MDLVSIVRDVEDQNRIVVRSDVTPQEIEYRMANLPESKERRARKVWSEGLRMAYLALLAEHPHAV